MRFHKILDDILGQKGKVKILRCLIFATANLTAREIARRTGLSPWACIKTLRELELLELINMEIAGRSHLYSLNQENIINKDMLLPLFEKEKDLIQSAIVWVIESLQVKPVSVILFGSFAREEEALESDIDLCFLVKSPQQAQKTEEEILKIAPTFYQIYGKKISLYVTQVTKFRKNYEKGMDTIREIVRNGIHMYGKPISEILT